LGSGAPLRFHIDVVLSKNWRDVEYVAQQQKAGE
jgi:hypothetical protein